MPELVSLGCGPRSTVASSLGMPIIAERRERYQNSATTQDLKCVVVSLDFSRVDNANEQDIKSSSTRVLCKSSGICTGMRRWSTVYSVLTAALLSLITGFTMGYSSPTLIELAKLKDPDLRFGSTLSDIYGVSLIMNRS